MSCCYALARETSRTTLAIAAPACPALLAVRSAGRPAPQRLHRHLDDAHTPRRSGTACGLSSSWPRAHGSSIAFSRSDDAVQAPVAGQAAPELDRPGVTFASLQEVITAALARAQPGATVDVDLGGSDVVLADGVPPEEQLLFRHGVHLRSCRLLLPTTCSILVQCDLAMSDVTVQDAEPPSWWRQAMAIPHTLQAPLIQVAPGAGLSLERCSLEGRCAQPAHFRRLAGAGR